MSDTLQIILLRKPRDLLHLFVDFNLERVVESPCQLALRLADPLEAVPKQFVAVFVHIREHINDGALLKVRMDVFCWLLVSSASVIVASVFLVVSVPGFLTPTIMVATIGVS